MTCKTFTMACLLCCFIATSANAVTIISESFESDPGGTYALSNQFDDAGFNFFDRYVVPDNSNPARDDFQNGWDGDYGILGQDHDGDGFDPTQTITIAGIGISGASGLSITLSVGALASEAAGFDNYEAADNDGIEIYATIDAGTRTFIGSFAPPALSANGAVDAGDLYLDTNLDQVGDGTRLTVDLADFTFAIAGTGNSLDIEIELTSTSSFEPLAVDNVRVNQIPEPASLVLLAVGLAMACPVAFGRRN